MSYLTKLGLGRANYDRTPSVAVPGYADSCCAGWDEIIGELRKALGQISGPRVVLAIETYTGVLDAEIISALREGLRPDLWVSTIEEAFRSVEEIDALVAPDLGGNDPVFGRLSRLSMVDFFAPDRQTALKARIARGLSLTVVYGPGALLCCEPDLLVYADMPRWEGQLRQRANLVPNLGADNREQAASLQYKRSFFVDWRVCDKLKRSSLAGWDYLLDTTRCDSPVLVTGEAFRAGLDEAARRPFRVVPFFDPGVWGGQWMREICGLPEGPPNYAWCFDCVPEENSLVLDFGSAQVEVPAINLVFHRPIQLLGEPVFGRFGAEFPIRFDLLDTMGGQNLSFQVHPLVDYAREHFGLSYTQDESYYLLDAAENAVVYLGLKNSTTTDALFEDLEAAQRDPRKPFPDERHVARFPARRHDHFLIPAGTCHCSGRDSLVLEISATPYIFTFKLWDWARVDLNGQPRPINLERGRPNLLPERNETYVRQSLINRVVTIASGAGWREERTGLHPSQFIETRRHWFTRKVTHDTERRSVNVLNLVQGSEVVVESPNGSFAPFVVHFAETFIVPAAVGTYTVRPHGAGEGQECVTLKAFVRQ